MASCPTCRRPFMSATGYENHISKCTPEVPVPLQYAEVCQLTVLCHMLSPFFFLQLKKNKLDFRDRVPEDQPVSEFIFTFGDEVSKEAIDLAQKEPRLFVIGKVKATQVVSSPTVSVRELLPNKMTQWP